MKIPLKLRKRQRSYQRSATSIAGSTNQSRYYIGGTNPDKTIYIFIIIALRTFSTTTDSLTRFNARQNPRLARWRRALFSLGRGAVVKNYSPSN
jgi:hypothetical protein